MTRKLLFVMGITLLTIAAALFVWGPHATRTVSAQDGQECTPGAPCPDWIVQAWSGSAHANADSEPFRHWDSTDPQEIPTSCAKCHSEAGYLDFLGADGSEAGVVDQAAPVGSVITCTVCHNPVTVDKTDVVFPSGVDLEVGVAARCMVCHQGRESTVSVNQAITDSGAGADDVSDKLSFRNVHYFAAAASLYGGEAMGGYQYEGQTYQPQLLHVPDFNTCTECHSPHTLEVQVDKCATCHTGVATVDDLKNVRMPSSKVDYDGDGNVDEGIYQELEGLQALLLQAIQSYGNDVLSAPIAYSADSYPYFFADANGNGAVDEGETAYASWTPRLLEAAYNYQFYEKDPGAFAHNARYHAELMYDSIASLNEALMTPVDLSMAHRNPPAHFDGASEPFRHWDSEGEVSAACVRCHTAEGLPMYVHNNTTIAVEPSVSFACTTCHTSLPEFSLLEVSAVTVPSGMSITFGENIPANLCLECHQGRESTVSVNKAIAGSGAGDDDVSDKLSFRNVHYLAAGATLFGSEAEGAYQYDGKEYNGRFMHVPNMYSTCTDCHDPHTQQPHTEVCSTCHQGITSVEDIRMTSGDYDGDGAEEGVAGEVKTFQEDLLAAIQAYAANTAGTPIIYDTNRYPYFFADANGNGTIDEGEGAYASWTPRLLRAAYNLQYSIKDPGAFVHNGKYIIQTLYDSLEDIGGADAVAGMTRP
jgi:hypothetical protein